MDLTPVKSSVLTAVGYARDTLTLRTELTSGAIYDYFAVPPWIHEALMSASSLGEYYNQHIRDRYRWEKLREPATQRQDSPW